MKFHCGFSLHRSRLCKQLFYGREGKEYVLMVIQAATQIAENLFLLHHYSIQFKIKKQTDNSFGTKVCLSKHNS
jgi:hypothetical protein